jgi:lysophospholipase L1-like esterase
MKIFKQTPLLLLSVFVIGFVGCTDYEDVDPEVPASDVSKYVAVGNSLTAGFQNNALYEEGQKSSFANMLAEKLAISDFENPLVSGPGLIPGRLELADFGTSSIQPNPDSGSPLNANLPRPYDNLGIPGSILVDYLNPGNAGDLVTRATDQTDPRFNPYYGLVMRDELSSSAAPNIHNLVAAQNPDLVTFWLGNNDVLGFVTSGGEGQSITPTANFQQLFQGSAQALGGLGTKVAFMNIPNVTSIPFVFLTNGRLVAQQLLRVNNGVYQLLVDPQNGVYMDIYIETDSGTRTMLESDFLLLSAQTYLGQVQAGQVNPPVSPQTPVPDNLVLDGPTSPQPDGSSELVQAITAVQTFNGIIANTVASNDNFVLVDVNATFNTIFNNFVSGEPGYVDEAGEGYDPIPGDLFSFDGVHPTNKGHAIVANLIINTLNNEFGYSIRNVNVAATSMGLVLSDSNN